MVEPENTKRVKRGRSFPVENRRVQRGRISATSPSHFFQSTFCKVARSGLGRGSPGRGRGAGSSVFGCVRGPGGAGGGGLGGRWAVCRCAGRCRVRRLPAVVFRGLWSFPVFLEVACLSVWFGRMIPGLYGVIQYTLSLVRFGVGDQ
jgi:hypothetical protein